MLQNLKFMTNARCGWKLDHKHFIHQNYLFLNRIWQNHKNYIYLSKILGYAVLNERRSLYTGPY